MGLLGLHNVPTLNNILIRTKNNNYNDETLDLWANRATEPLTSQMKCNKIDAGFII